MKPKTSHQNNENFAFTTQFPDIWITVGKSQNFHGKHNGEFRKTPIVLYLSTDYKMYGESS